MSTVIFALKIERIYNIKKLKIINKEQAVKYKI